MENFRNNSLHGTTYLTPCTELKGPFGLEEATDGPTSTFDGAISSQDEESTDTPVLLPVINETVSFGRGSSCTQQSDCDDVLVCLPSNTCGCPDLTPVLVQEADGIVCVAARKLSEPCQTDAECRHGNEHARCLDSACSCQSRFYASVDGSLCMADTLVWNPLRTAIFPAALLIVGFIVLGAIGFQRLHRPRSDKAWYAQQLSSLPKDIGYSGSDRIPSDFYGSVNEHEGHANDSVWSRLRSFVSSVTLRMEAAKRRCRWSFSDRSRSYANTPNETSIDRVATHIEYSNQTSLPSQLSSALPHAPSGSMNGASPHSVPPASVSMQPTLSATSSAVNMKACKETKSESPVPRPRTRISTLSTSTLMPSRRARRRGNCSSSSASSAPSTRHYGNQPSFWVSGMSNLCEPIAEGTADEPENTGAFAAKLPEFVKFTESELRGEIHRKFRSEELAMPVPTRLRRVVSDHDEHLEDIFPDSYSDESPEKQARSSSGCCCGHSCPNVHFYGSSIEPSSNPFGRDQEPCMRWFSAEHCGRKSLEVLFTRSQPTWRCDRVVCKGPDRKARTWEAFTIHGRGAWPKAIKKRFVSAHMARGRQSRLMTGDHRSTSGGDSGRRYPGALSVNTESIGALSVAAVGVPSPVSSLASPQSTPKRDFGRTRRSRESCSPGPTEQRMALVGCASHRAALMPRVAQVAPFSRRSQTLDSEREIVDRGAGRKVSSGSAISSRISR
ncbi:uncharacterized protein LOC125947836 [Dermacentor silvarum]|uniref:uncharacterized protein LOC125947836 n=1 Tax=Dermacentor silvarum TaxID=543639 RepID=UPI002100DE85|nr:uncharacterized protein LOC125947836 [Dermacentor silvarum]